MEVNEDISVRSTLSPTSETVETVELNLTVCPTTGGQFEISISSKDTIENLRKKIGRRLQTPYERLNLLLKEKILTGGKISDHNIQNGSKVTLLPAVESGFSSTVQGTQQSIIQAIESLSDSQIDDFLSGRSPLTLALRVGDHMMFVQLQLEQSVNPTTSTTPESQSRSTSNYRQQQQQVYDKISRLSSQCVNSSSATSPQSLKDTSPAAISQSALELLKQRDGSSSLSSAKQSLDSSKSPLDHLTTACDGFNLKRSQSAVNVNKKAATSSRDKSASETSYRKPSTTCGKITSGVGPLSNHGSSSGSRVVRQMQRLRRLCSAHQQCVVYSNRELASEISSIVHAAKHLSSEQGSGASSHRRKNSTRDRAKTSSSGSGAQPASRAPAPGASIDSVTTHGPGIFSGTFSGSLHPNIQDSDGRPKRDPQTILQILTDLLSATDNYEGQTGSVGMLPQLFKDHFSKQSTSTSSTSSDQVNTKQDKPRASGSQFHPQRSQSKQSSQRSHSHSFSSAPHSSHMGIVPSCHPYQQLLACSAKSPPLYRGSTPARSSFLPAELYGQRMYGKCPHSRYNYRLSNASYGSSSGSSYSKRSKKQQPSINVPRLHQRHQENWLTRKKVEALREEMKMKRSLRQRRRLACGPYQKPTERGNDSMNGAGQLGLLKANPSPDSTSVGCADSSIDMDIDDIREYADDRKTEVAHESPETVTV